MELKGKTIALLSEEFYNEFELWYPYYRLIEAGAEVKIIGSGKASVYHSKLGMPVTVDVSIDQVTADQFDGVVIPGGYAPDHMRRHKAMVKLVKDLFAAGKVVAAICHAGWMLASADVLKGRRATCFFAIKDDLVNAGAEYVDEPVVVDGNLITSRMPSDLPVFMPAIIAALKS